MSLRLNVQEQNSLTFERMLSTAKQFRENAVAPALTAFLRTHEIEVDSSAIVWARSDSYMLGFEHGIQGLLVTPSHRFFEFELEWDAQQLIVTHVHEFSDVTATQNMSIHNRGIGKGNGALAVSVLEVLNAG
jgi:hypothetical protein